MPHRPIFSKDEYFRMLDEKLNPSNRAQARPLLDRILQVARQTKMPRLGGNGEKPK